MNTKETALKLAEHGFAVVPVAAGTKDRPLIAWGDWANRVPDVETVREWWAQFPDANIALLTGPSKLAVVDIDPRNGGDPDAFDKLVSPRTFTPSGGMHKFCEATTYVETRNGVLPGIDIKAATGYVIFPPSRTNDGRGWTMSEQDFENFLARRFPSWQVAARTVVDLLAKLQDAGERDKRTEQWVQEAMEHGVPRGQRNDVLTRLAGFYAGRLPLDVAQTILWEWLRHKCPWDEGDWDRRQCDDLVARIFKRAEANAPTTVYFTQDRSLFNVTKDSQYAKAMTLFRTAPEFTAEAVPDVDWLIPNVFIASTLHNLHGEPKSGKSTFIAFALKALLNGSSFLGEQAPKACPVVWLTEQPPSSFNELLEDADLRDEEHLHILQYMGAQGIPWDVVVKASVDRAMAVESPLIVVDTTSKWAGLRGDAENSAGEVLAVLDPLQYALQKGIAVVLVSHDRKSGGTVVSAGRGSNALSGECDVLLQLVRHDGNNLADFNYTGRFGDIPEHRLIEYGDDGFTLLDKQQRRGRQVAKRLRRLIASLGGHLTSEWQTVQDLMKKTGRKKITVQKQLQQLREFEDLGLGVVETEERANRQIAYRLPVTEIRLVN